MSFLSTSSLCTFYAILNHAMAKFHDIQTMTFDIIENEQRYMTGNEGIELLLKINSKRKDDAFTPSTLVCVVARAGSEAPVVAGDQAEKLLDMDFGPPLHSIVIPGDLHFKEIEGLITLGNAPKNIF